MIKSRTLLPLLFSALALQASANDYATTSNASSDKSPLIKSLDLGLNLGTTGIGLDLTLPVADKWRLRAGVGYIPRTNVPMSFNLMAYAGENDDPGQTEDQRFDRLSGLMEQFTGIRVDKKVDMHAKGTMVDFKLLVDFFPLRNNKHWYATAGFYWGSHKVGHIENTIREAPSLMGVIMYNNMYDFFVNEKFYDKPIYGDAMIDPVLGDEMREKFLRYGRVGAHLGDFKEGAPVTAGQPYMLQPDENGTIHADMYVNSFKPYIGIGYTACVSKDGRWNIGFDAGALFWGKPKILSHERYIYHDDGSVSYGSVIPEDHPGHFGDYVDVAKDVDGINGKVGTYCDIAKTVSVYPVLNFRITYKLF